MRLTSRGSELELVVAGDGFGTLVGAVDEPEVLSLMLDVGTVGVSVLPELDPHEPAVLIDAGFLDPGDPNGQNVFVTRDAECEADCPLLQLVAEPKVVEHCVS